MLEALDRLDESLGDLRDAARRRDLHLIWRGQVRGVRAVTAQDGRVEGQIIETSRGQGLQLVSDSGATAMASRDDLDAAGGAALLDRLAGIVRSAERLGVERAHWPPLAAETGREVPEAAGRLDSVQLAPLGRMLLDWERRLSEMHPNVGWRLTARFEVDGWRIAREDGTDVTFAIPRGLLAATATSRGRERHSILATLFVRDVTTILDEDVVFRFIRRADRAGIQAAALGDAPPYPAGSRPVLIDYALAKGLAHEAFGHAAEADGFRSSILAKGGRFRVGDEVGPAGVSIIDEPVTEDHAWQPFSSNGIRRGRATIVDRGKLKDGLSDPWSADAGGVALTGAARAESYRNAPQPRMTNIRIEVDNPIPVSEEFEDLGPDEVRQLLMDSDVLRRHERVAFLSGYSGGQVNTSTGDFVFNCKAIYEIGRDGIELFRPAIFSGSMFGALGGIREAFGPLLLDAMGYCGKWGQSVPSSGGSHYFLAIEPDPSIRLGGR